MEPTAKAEDLLRAARRLCRGWKHGEDCPARLVEVEDDNENRIGVGCECGLSELQDILWPEPDLPVDPVPSLGWQPAKFVVRHWSRGVLSPGEAFVLVPDRDPAAVEALCAYAQATPDMELRGHLLAWAERLGWENRTVEPENVIPSWVASLQDEVKAGRMTVETALFRIAALARGAA